MATVKICKGAQVIMQMIMREEAASLAYKSFVPTEGLSVVVERSVTELLELLKEESGSLERKIILSILKDRGFLKRRVVMIDGVSSDILIGAE
jgi:hypothetical protein